ncbi:MAG: hypothetical protein WAR79_19205 [Melioribacteraceae bacterium]
MNIDYDLIEKQNYQITTKSKIYYYVSYLLLPIMMFGVISTSLSIWVLGIIIFAFLYFHRSYLDLPSQSSIIDLNTLIRPIKAIKARLKLIRPNENDQNNFSKINILYVVFCISYISIQLIIFSIIIFLLYILIKGIL